MLEAQPFIEQLSLQPCICAPFGLYRHKHISLVISGIGKTNAAMASAWLILTEAPKLIVNAGAAGATDTRSELGSIYQISEVIEPDRMIFEAYDNIPDQIRGFPSAVLATQDKPLKLPEDRKMLSADAQMTDMEGASVVQVCKSSKFPVICSNLSAIPRQTIASEKTSRAIGKDFANLSCLLYGT
ncbi:MAG: 5'-methylthioadenosine/S-adenosylhomocysteine nucleosidase [Desulfobacteraceae bacterium]|nr:5'-methylthioadenosine/S-adenosylhomocysteine nucleosidase [Desulfobacteraceae bacterium]